MPLNDRSFQGEDWQPSAEGSIQKGRWKDRILDITKGIASGLVSASKQNIRGLKNFFTAPIDETRPMFIIIWLGLAIYILEVMFFNNTNGARLPNYIYFPMHFLMGLVAIAVVGRRSPSVGTILLITVFYILLPFGQFLIDAHLKSLLFRLGNDIGRFFIEFFLSPIAYPIWVMYGLYRSKIRIVHLIPILYIILIISLGVGSAVETSHYQKIVEKAGEYTGAKGITKETILNKFDKAWENAKAFPSKIRKQAQLEHEKAIEYATGGYYQGKEEEGAKEELGVFIEQVKPAQTTFFDNEEIILWATLKAHTLDEENPINIDLECSAGEEEEEGGKIIKGDILPEDLVTGFQITSLEAVDIGCRFSPEDVARLGPGLHPVRFTADFDLSTQANLKTYFMDKQRKRALIREGIDIFKQYGIKDTEPVAEFTKGPVKIGAQIENLPIGIEANSQAFPRLGITIENLWQGKIAMIKSLEVNIPAGIRLINCPLVNPKSKEEEIEIDLSSFEKRVKDVDKFFSISCIMDIIDTDKLLDKTPITTRYIVITTRYDYELETEFNIEIKKSKTPEEEGVEKSLQLKSEDFNVNVKNIRILSDYLREVIGINKKCLESAETEEIITLIKSSKTFGKDQKQDLIDFFTKNCKEDKTLLLAISEGMMEWALDNMIEQYNKAEEKLTIFAVDKQTEKEGELEAAVITAHSAIDEALEHLKKFNVDSTEETESKITNKKSVLKTK